MLILLDGPEKAGKTTIATELAWKLNGVVVHWGPCTTDRVYQEGLRAAAVSKQPVIWDRGWPSEHVYSEMLGRGRRLGADPWLGEWLYGRAFQTCGVRAIIAGPDPTQLAALRTPDDLNVDPAIEQRLFVEYGSRFGYMVIHNRHTKEDVERTCELLLHQVRKSRGFSQVPTLPYWAGPADAPVVVVFGTKPDAAKGADEWLPGTSTQGIALGRVFGDKGLAMGWTTCFTCPPAYLRSRSIVIPVGRLAALWAWHNLPTVFTHPIPSLINLAEAQRVAMVLEVSKLTHLGGSHE